MTWESISNILLWFTFACLIAAGIITIILKVTERNEKKMSKTSSEAKNRWNAANYDSYRVQLPKGQKALLKAACEKNGVSMNSVFTEAAEKYIKMNAEESLS